MELKAMLEKALRAEADGVPVDFKTIVVQLYNSILQQEAQAEEVPADGEG